MNSSYYVYILTNNYNKVLYIGVTNNIIKRIYEHKNKLHSVFTAKYNINKLVYYEIFDSYNAISREKEIKGWTRVKKINLINSNNPKWKDIYDEL